jgi:hypothetical protein
MVSPFDRVAASDGFKMLEDEKSGQRSKGSAPDNARAMVVRAAWYDRYDLAGRRSFGSYQIPFSRSTNDR